jgi:glycosyltransferase involved in cell wall biosynthesis
MATPQYHIAHVLPSPFVGGTEHATLRIALSVRERSFRGTMFCPGESSPARELFADHGLTTVGYSAVDPSFRRPGPFLKASLRLAREFRRRGVDLVHCSDILAGYYAALAGKIAGLPVLCHVRCCFEAISRRDRSFLYPVDKFAFVSREAWRRFGLHVPARRGIVLYDGIEVERGGDEEETRLSVRREFGIPEGVAVVGMVARVTPAKDYATLIKAAAKVVAANPRVRFLIVGDYSQSALNREHYAAVKGLLAARDLTQYFIFTGHREDAGRLVSAMDISVLSTHTEGLPLVLLEAMARAKPVIATAVGGVSEVVEHGRTGLLHGHQDDAALAEQITALLTDPARASSLGEDGRRFVAAHFTKSQFTAHVSDLYRGMLAGRPPRLVECHNY